MKNRMWWLNEAKIIISDQIVKYTILFWHLLNELNNLYIMLIISTPIITKADLIEGSIINCVQCDIQIHMNMNEIKVRVTRSRKVESLRLDLSFHGTNYHRLHLFARPCYTHCIHWYETFFSTFAFRRNWNESTKMLPKTATIGFQFEKEAWSVTQNQARNMCPMYADKKFSYFEKPQNDENDTNCCTSLPKKLPTATLIIWIIMISYSIISLHIWFLVCILLPINLISSIDQ